MHTALTQLFVLRNCTGLGQAQAPQGCVPGQTGACLLLPETLEASSPSVCSLPQPLCTRLPLGSVPGLLLGWRTRGHAWAARAVGGMLHLLLLFLRNPRYMASLTAHSISRMGIKGAQQHCETASSHLRNNGPLRSRTAMEYMLWIAGVVHHKHSAPSRMVAKQMQWSSQHFFVRGRAKPVQPLPFAVPSQHSNFSSGSHTSMHMLLRA